jgi:hypothetical protein
MNDAALSVDILSLRGSAQIAKITLNAMQPTAESEAHALYGDIFRTERSLLKMNNKKHILTLSAQFELTKDLTI